MKKSIGYILMGIGLIVFLLSFPQVSSVVKIPVSEGLVANVLMIVGMIVIIIGGFILSKGESSSGKVQEVPIYHGKEVVGFRRIKK